MAPSSKQRRRHKYQGLRTGVVTHMVEKDVPSPVRREKLRNRLLSFEPLFDRKGKVVAREPVL